MIVVMGQTKGGVGKTTLAINVAVEKSRAGEDILLVDADEQSTASDFTDLRESTLGSAGYTCIKLSGIAVHTQVKKMMNKYTNIIIDAGGRDTSGMRAALTVADLVVVPFQPRSFDLWTLDKVSELVTEARAVNPALRAVSVLNACDPSGTDNQDAAEVLRNNDTIKYLDIQIGRRKAFSNAVATGLGVSEIKRPDLKANTEMHDLLNALYQSELAMV